MALFGFKKKTKEKKSAATCRCSCESKNGEKPLQGISSRGQTVNGQTVNCQTVNEVCCVKVLGAGCKSCHEQYENAKTAVKNLGLDIEVEYITDMEKVMSYGVMSMPAIVLNDRVVSAGKVLKTADIERLLQSF